MPKSSTVVGIVPARGGSKGLPGKNLLRIGGKPLIAYTILTAKQAHCLDRIIVTTDSPEIAAVSRRYGAEVPFLRPKRLARDTTHTPAVIEHAIVYLEKHEAMEVNVIVTLQPTSPFRRPEQIDSAVKMLLNNRRFDSVITVREVRLPPFWMFRRGKNVLFPFVNNGIDYSLKERQQLPSVYGPNGAVYVTRRELLRDRGLLFSAFAGGRTGSVLMDERASLDIDGPVDFMLAKMLIEKHPDLLRR
jgi:CMP-N,N'-diacetyllegionaminic acid synthase